MTRLAVLLNCGPRRQEAVVPRRRAEKSAKRSDPPPRVDLVLCRDCLVHFSFADIFTTLRNIRNKSLGLWEITHLPL